MLGLGSSIISGSFDQEFTPLSVANCIGWWDFSDTETMYEENDSYTTQVTSNDDPIGRVKNKATIPTRLGNFLRTKLTGNRPLYKSADGGYAQFDGTDDAFFGARAVSNSDTQTLDAGAVSVDEFSTVQIDAQTLAIIAVVKPDSATPSTDETIFDSNGLNLGTSEVLGWSIANEATGDGYGRMYFYYNSDTNDDLTGSTDLGTNKQILTGISAAGTNASKIYINETQDGTATVDADPVMVFTGDAAVTSGSTKGSGISIGGNLNASSVVTGGLWEGRIYEVLVFNQSLSDNDRDLLWDYLNTKHSIY